MDMSETGEVYAGAVDGRREYDNVLPREEGAAVVGLAAGDGVMGHEMLGMLLSSSVESPSRTS